MAILGLAGCADDVVGGSGDLSILLGIDTRYLGDGQLVDADSLKPNMRVFVRAGKDLYNEVEAYQVIWGTILSPR